MLFGLLVFRNVRKWYVFSSLIYQLGNMTVGGSDLCFVITFSPTPPARYFLDPWKNLRAALKERWMPSH